jgi:hypothetical protein
VSDYLAIDSSAKGFIVLCMALPVAYISDVTLDSGSNPAVHHVLSIMLVILRDSFPYHLLFPLQHHCIPIATHHSKGCRLANSAWNLGTCWKRFALIFRHLCLRELLLSASLEKIGTDSVSIAAEERIS